MKHISTNMSRTESRSVYFQTDPREIVAIHNGGQISPLYISEELYAENIAKTGKISGGDLLVTGVGSIGVPYLVKPSDRFYFKDGNIIWLKNDESKMIGRFLHLLYQSTYVQSQITRMAGVGTVGTYTIDNAKRTKVVFPCEPAEQRRITDCFTALDTQIAAEDRALEALQAHKKGLMQQLFPQPGQTQPRLRFPEFRDKGEWEEKKLGDVSEVLMCKRIFASETSPNGEVPFYKIGTLGGVPNAFISKNLFEKYKSKYNFPRIGEVLITCSGTIGKCLPYDGSEAYFQDSNIVWIDNLTLEVSNEFLLSILSNVNWSTLNSTTITRIYGPDLRGLPIKFPQNEKEQQRITDCLSTLDIQIIAQAAKIETLKTHKRGLMQQLFPSPEEH